MSSAGSRRPGLDTNHPEKKVIRHSVALINCSYTLMIRLQILKHVSWVSPRAALQQNKKPKRSTAPAVANMFFMIIQNHHKVCDLYTLDAAFDSTMSSGGLPKGWARNKKKGKGQSDRRECSTRCSRITSKPHVTLLLLTRHEIQPCILGGPEGRARSNTYKKRRASGTPPAVSSFKTILQIQLKFIRF